MNLLPHVTAVTRERIAQEFDHLGPDACVAEITDHLRQHNPELLDMIVKSASDLGPSFKIIQGISMFYRLLVMQSRADVGKPLLNLLPRVTPETRDLIVEQIDEKGSEIFTLECIEDLERSNPELLQMAHNFASRHADYLGVMQAFALLYRSLFLQSFADRTRLH
jgi:hypothetical protein